MGLIAGSQASGRTLLSTFRSASVIGILAVCLAWAGTAGAQSPPGMIVSYPAALNTNAASDAGASVSACGVCWNASASPTTTDSKTTGGSGVFTSNITGLTGTTRTAERDYE